MARAEIFTLMPLDTFASILGLSPWEFNGAKHPVAKSAQCKDVLYSYPWQHDHLSRQEVAQAIADAEQMLTDELGYFPSPAYVPDEELPYTVAWRPGGHLPPILELKRKHFITAGVQARTEIGTIDDTDLAAVDLDGDDVFESFTATINDPAIADITDPNELVLYFAPDDRMGQPMKETWRIRPVSVEITGSQAVFTGHRTLLIKPALQNAVNIKPLDPGSADTYVTEVVCYRVYTDDSATAETPNQGVAIWDRQAGCHSPDCSGSSHYLCLGHHNDKRGQVYASFARNCPARRPNCLTVNYFSGLALENGQMQEEMAHVVTYLAAALLANESCDCERTQRILAFWKERPQSFVDEANKATAYSKDFNSIPFPVTRGGIYAWQRVKRWKESGNVTGLPA